VEKFSSAGNARIAGSRGEIMGRFNILLLGIGIIILASVLYIIAGNSAIPFLQQDNKTILSGLARDYYDNHEYTLERGYVCLDMAMDFWDVVIAHKMNAKIVVGNRTRMPDAIINANHAWVIVEVEPDNWVPVEVVNGSVMYGTDIYYHGWIFNSPQEIKDFLDEYDIVIAHWNTFVRARSKYNEEVQVYNNLIGDNGDRTEIERMSLELKDLKIVVEYTGLVLNQSQVKLGEYENGLPKILGMATI